MDILSWALKLTRCVLDHDSEGFLLHYDQLLLDTQLTEEVQAVLSRTRELTRLPLGEFLQLEENYGKIQVPRDMDTGVDWCPASCDRLSWSVEEHGCPRLDCDRGEEKSSKIKSGHQGGTAKKNKDEPVGGNQNQSCPEEAPQKTPQSEGHPVSQAQVEHHDRSVPADGPLGVQAGQFTPSECTGENANSDEKMEESVTLNPKTFPFEPPMGRDSKLPDSFCAAPHQLHGREKSVPSEACKTAWQEVGTLQRHGGGDKQTRSRTAHSCTYKMGTFCKVCPEEGSAGLERRPHAIMRTPKRPFRGHKVGKTVPVPPSGPFGTWDSSNYDVVPEIESLSRQEQSEPSPLSSSTGHNIRNRRLATAGNSGGGGGAALLGVGGRSSGTPVPYNSHYHHHHHHHHHHQPQQDGRRSPRIWNEYRKDRDRRWSSGKMWENSQRRSWNHSHGGGGEATGEKVAAPGTQTKPEKIKVDDVSAWTLFKPPPAFPVDNSSAKIVPKISYASKVKGNLQHRQAGSGSMGGEEPQSLGAIFQNEWGLSFINEPSGSENTDPAQELNSKTDSDPVTQPAPHFGNGVTPEPPAIMDTDRLARLPTPSQEPEEPCTEQPPEMHYSLMEALRYHAQAWEQTCMRHKQDPKLVIWYEESLEQPA